MLSFSTLPKWAVLGLAFPLICLNGWLLYKLCVLLHPIPSIVVTASLIAFLLDYPIRFVEKQGAKRGWAIALVLLIALIAMGILAVFLGPLVWQQLNEFAERLPRWIEQAKTQLLSLEHQGIFQNLPIQLDQLTIQLANRLSSALESATSQVINITLSTIDSAVNFLATVVLSILLVLNGDRLWDGLLSWFPDVWQTRIQDSLQPSFKGYFSGQATLALILATAQSVAFMVLGVPFGLLFGIGIGLISVIPFGGLVAVLGVSGLLAFQDLWLGFEVLAVAAIIGQVNDNVVAPRLMGGITGLNPVIIIVSILVGAKFAGFLGLVLAVPTASFLKRIADSLREPQGSLTV